MNEDVKEYCSPLFAMVAETVRSMQSLRGWSSVTVSDLAIEISPIVASTVFAPLFYGEDGTLDLNDMICDVLQERFEKDEVEVANGMVHFFPSFTANFNPDGNIANSQRDCLALSETTATLPSAIQLIAAERFIAKISHREGIDLDPYYVAHMIKNGMDAGFMTIEDIEAIQFD